MRIVLDLYILPGASLPDSGIFLTEMIVEMARRHANHSFIFLALKPTESLDNLPGNVAICYINRTLSKWMGKKTWYKYVLPKELARLKADLFVTADNVYLKKMRTPACMFLIHLNALWQEGIPVAINGGILKRLNHSIKNASMIITFSENDRQLIQRQSPVSSDKIKLLRLQVTGTLELKWTEKEMVKIEFSGGVEYFVFAGDLHERFDLVTLLKAFSLFKKRQQSNMQLLIVGSKTSWSGQFSQKLASYKYRNDVKLITGVSKENIQRIIAAAYAFVYPALYDHFPVNLLEAMQVGVPVITTPIPVCKEWGGTAVMYPKTNDAAGFANSLQLMYKDENLRSGFINEAKKQLLPRVKNDMIKACRIFFDKCIAK